MLIILLSFIMYKTHYVLKDIGKGDKRGTRCGSKQIQYGFPITQFTLFNLCHNGCPEVCGEARPRSRKTGNWMRAFLFLDLSFSISKIRECMRNDKRLACISQVCPSSPTADITNRLQNSFTLSTYTALDCSAWHCRLPNMVFRDGKLNGTYLLTWGIHLALA